MREDLDTFREVLRLVRDEGFEAQSVKVGSIEVSLQHQVREAIERPSPLTPEQRAALVRSEYERVMYAAAEGPE